MCCLHVSSYKTGDQIEVVGLVAAGKKLTVSAKPMFLDYVKNKVINYRCFPVGISVAKLSTYCYKSILYKMM